MENKRGLILTVVFFFCFIPLFSQQAPTSGKEVKQVENDLNLNLSNRIEKQKYGA